MRPGIRSLCQEDAVTAVVRGEDVALAHGAAGAGAHAFLTHGEVEHGARGEAAEVGLGHAVFELADAEHHAEK